MVASTPEEFVSVIRFEQRTFAELVKLTKARLE
jgi:hypothetical protein